MFYFLFVCGTTTNLCIRGHRYSALIGSAEGSRPTESAMTQEFFSSTHQRTPTEGAQINKKLMDIESGDRMESFRSMMKIEFQTAEWPS